MHRSSISCLFVDKPVHELVRFTARPLPRFHFSFILLSWNRNGTAGKDRFEELFHHDPAFNKENHWLDHECNRMEELSHVLPVNAFSFPVSSPKKREKRNRK